MNFCVVMGVGSMYAGSSLTNANENAQDYWTMGSTPGPAMLEVRAVGPASGSKQNFATFTAADVDFALEVLDLTLGRAAG